MCFYILEWEKKGHLGEEVMIDMIITDTIVVIDMTAENVMIDMIEIEITSKKLLL